MGKFLMRVLTEWSLLMGLLCIHDVAQAQYTLEDSKIPIIEKMSAAYKGRSLSLADLDRLIREISQDGLFQVVQVEHLGGGRVVLRAQQSRRLKAILLQGERTTPDEQILDKIGLKPGQLVSPLEIKQAVARLETEYKNMGYFNFSIQTEEQKADDGLNLIFIIQEKGFCLIDKIKVTSKNPELDSLLRRELKMFKGQNYKKSSNSKIEKQINKILLENRYLTARLSGESAIFNEDKTRVQLNFNISNPTQHDFLFYGNEFFSHYDLVRESGVGTKFLFLSDSSTEIIESITELYQKKGFASARVEFKEEYFGSLNKKVLVFKIEEGPRIQIGAVRVTGKISRAPSYYEKIFRSYLGEQPNSIYFVQEDVEKAAEEMVLQLKREGHLQAELTSFNVEINPLSQADISIQVDEGLLTYIRQVLFRGAKSFSNIELQEYVGLETNKPLRIDLVEASFEKLNAFYKERAFLDFKIQNPDASVIQYKPGQPYADIVFQVEEGSKVRVGEIRVTGLKKTYEYVVRRELDFQTGDYLFLSKVTTSVQRLEQSGLFGKVEIRTLEKSDSSKDSTVVIEVEERRPGLFSSGIGLFSDGFLTYRGYVGALYNNIGGKARALSARVDLRYQQEVDYPQNRLSLAYYEPYIFEDRVRGRVSLIREQQLTDLRLREPDILSTNEMRFSLEKEINSHFRFTYNAFGFSNQEVFRVSDLSTRRSFNVGMTGPIVELDYRNDRFIPTKGSYTRFELEYAHPYLGSTSRDPRFETGADGDPRFDGSSEINYYRATFSTTLYTPLTKSKRWVWVNSLRGGYLQNLSDRNGSGIPRVRSFFLGGASAIRGFGFGVVETVPGKRELCLKQRIIDISQGTDQCEFDSIFVRDDSSFFLVKSELRFPIAGSVGGMLFYDGGGVYLSEFSLEDPYRDSFGAGLKYDTPIGSFMLQVGYKLDRKTGGPGSFYDRESDFAIHLAIGNF